MALVERGRITLAIEESLERGIALIIAPAGYGKTEAIFGALGDKAVSLELPEGAVSVESVARALISRTSPRSGGALTQFLQRPADEERDAGLADWVAAKLRGLDVPIIVDDYQRIDADPSTRRLLTRIIESTAPKVRWVIASRETPELPVGTYLAQDWMRFPLTGADLAFSFDEAQELAALLEVKIATADLSTIVNDAEGWPLVVRLALSAWDRTRALGTLRIRTNPLLFDFIDAQVWNQTSADDRRFLLAGALLPEVRPGVLASAGFTNTRMHLEQLERRIPLLRKMPNGDYRFHELFREFIITRHAHTATYADVVDSLINGLEKSEAYSQALLLSTRSSAWARTLQLLETHGLDLLRNGDQPTVKDVLTSLPPKNRSLPVVTALRGIILANEGSFGPAESDMQSVVDEPILPLDLRHQLQLRLAQFNINRGNPQAAIERITEVVRSQNPDDALDALTVAAVAYAMLGEVTSAQEAVSRTLAQLDSLRPESRARVLTRVAHTLLYLGDYSAAETRALAAAELAEAHGLASLSARAYSVLQNIATMTHADTVMALRYTQSWAQAAKESGEKITYAVALVSLSILAAERGDDELYESTIAELRDVRTALPTRFNVPLRWARVLHDAGLGRLREAHLAIRTLDLTQATEAAKILFSTMEAVINAAGDDVEAAATVLQKPMLTPAANDIESRQHLSYAHAYRTLGLWLIGRGTAARRSLGPPARDLPERDNVLISVIRTISTSSRSTMTREKLYLLTDPLLALDLHGHARFLRSLFRPGLTESKLTRTELDVLRELRHGGTSREVAEQLGCAPRTVEKHISRIMQKLECDGRGAAVAYAAAQGWLD